MIQIRNDTDIDHVFYQSHVLVRSSHGQLFRKRAVGSTVAQMKFDITMFKEGAHMRRKAWKPDKIVYLRPADTELLSFLVMKTDHGSAPYTPARCDLIEDDWETK